MRAPPRSAFAQTAITFGAEFEVTTDELLSGEFNFEQPGSTNEKKAQLLLVEKVKAKCLR